MHEKKEKIHISVLIVHYNTYGLLYQCLNSIKDSYGHLKIEIIIIDNTPASQQKKLSALKKVFTDIDLKLIDPKKNLGYAGGVNLGIKYCRGEFIAIINPDVSLLDGCLSTLYRFTKEKVTAGIVAPKLISNEGTVHPSCRTFPGPFVLFYKRLPILKDLPFIERRVKRHMMVNFDHNHETKVDWISGAFMFARREYIAEIGPMDERFFLYMEDVDWCRRFWQGKREVWYYPKAKALHGAQHLSTQFGLLGFFRKISWIHLVSYLKYFIKYRRPISRKTFK